MTGEAFTKVIEDEVNISNCRTVNTGVRYRFRYE